MRMTRTARTRLAAASGFAVALGLVGCTTSTTEAPEPSESSSTGGTWRAGPARYGSEIVRGRTIRMDDGVELRATIAFPADLGSGRRAAGDFPVVVEDSVYTEAVGFGSGPVDTYFAEHGYISVHVNSRGTGGSGGTGGFVGAREARDGAEVIRWAADELEGSDGRVAEVGCSWPGMQALADAAAVGRESPLKAVIAACAALGTEQRMDIMVSGVPTGDFGFVTSAADSSMGANRATRDWYHAFSDEVLAGGDAAYERDFWRERIPIDDAQRIVDNEVPVLLWTGWQDIVGLGAIRSWTALQNASAGRPAYAPMASDQVADPRYQLFVGDWGHAGGLDHATALRWLDTWVKGEDTGMQRTTDPLKLAETGSGRWVGTSTYPMVRRTTQLHLADGGRLRDAAASGGTDTIRWGGGGTLAYTGSRMDEATTLAGPVAASITVSSSNRNVQLAASLLDVAPNGTAEEITHGSIIGSLRALDRDRSWSDRAGAPVWPWQRLEQDEYLTPGTPTRLDIALEPRQWRIAAGHRLRLELTTQAGAQLTAPQQASAPGGTYRILLDRSSVAVPLADPGTFDAVPCRATTAGGPCLPVK